MDMTFQQYIDNPLGKKSAVFSQREMYKDLYTQKYGAILLRENGTFKTTMYYDKKTDRYFMHMQVPSEVVPKFYYDVVVEFYPLKAENKTENDLKNYGAKFFSNDPAFVFTYEYVFSKNGLFVEDLKSKASKLALKMKPEEKNPYEIPGYVKSLYFCFLHMKSRSLFNKTYWKQYALAYSKRSLVEAVTDSDTKVAERQRLGAEIEAAKRKEKEASKERTTAKQQGPWPREGILSKKNTKSVRVISPLDKVTHKPTGNVRIVKRKKS